MGQNRPMSKLNTLNEQVIQGKPPRPHTAGADRLGDAGIDLRLVVGAKTQGAGPDIGQYDDDGSVGAAGGGKIVVQSPPSCPKACQGTQWQLGPHRSDREQAGART